MSLAYEKVVAHLDRLKLKRVAELLDPVCEQASKEDLTYVDFLARLLEAEASSRAERRLVAKTRLAHFPFQKTLADFDFGFQPSIDKSRSRSCPPCVSSPTARTSSSWAHLASVRRTWPWRSAWRPSPTATTSTSSPSPKLLDQLARDVLENRLSERLTKLRVPTLLILDEMGYLPLDRGATSFLFQLVSKRYTKGSIIVTSNKSYVEWGTVFGDEFAAVAVIDRLLHYSTTVNIRGESYRLKDKKRAGIFTAPPAKQDP